MSEIANKKKRMSVGELTRMAFIWAEQDRQSLADCHCAGDPIKLEIQAEAEQLRQYRLKRWGRSRMEQILSTAKSCTIAELAEQKEK